MVGSGRKFSEEGFLEKLSNIAGYLLADIEKFPNIPYWHIPADRVRDWWTKKKLGKNSKINRLKALSLITSSGEKNEDTFQF